MSKMFRKVQFKFTTFSTVSLLLSVCPCWSFIEFSVNLKFCEDASKASEGNYLLHCSNFKDFTLCVESQFRCNFSPDCPIETTRRNETASDETDCADAFCNFELNNTCGWNLASPNEVHGNSISRPWRWTLNNSDPVGISKDHTFQQNARGHFLLANLQESQPGSQAVFQTPIIGSTIDNCTLEYYSYLTSQSVGKLQILQTYKLNSSYPGTPNTSTPIHELYTKILETVPADDTGTWRKHSISWAKNTFYSISFAVTIPSNADPATLQGMIAIDDISFVNCTKIKSNPLQLEDPFGLGCPADLFNCMGNDSSANCILPSRVCDTVHDCPNGIDESSCSCDDYPAEFCPTGECFVHNDTLKPTCTCGHGPECDESADPVQSNTFEFTLTIIVVSAGVLVVVLTLGFIAFILICQRPRWWRYSSRGSIEYGYDVSFVADTTQLQLAPRPSSSRMFRSTVSNSDLMVLDREWAD